MKPGQRGHRHTEADRERISRGLKWMNEQRRRAQRVLPRDLAAIEHGMPVRPDRVEDVRRGQALALAVLEALGGEDHTTPQERILLGDVGRLETLLGLLVRRALHAGDSDVPDLASRVGTLVTARARLLGMLGLSERRVERDLGAYLADREREPAREPAQAPPGRTIDVVPDPAPAPAADTSASASAEREGHAETVAADEEPAP